MRNLHCFSLLIGLTLILSGCATTSNSSGLSGLTARQLQAAGEKYLGAGDTANALKYLTEAERKKPGDPEVQYDLGLAYNQRGLTENASDHFQKALKIKPTYPEALNALGVVYAQKGQVELAQECLQKAMADPFYHTPQLAAYNLGRLFEERDDPDRALSMYQQAVRFQPSYGQAWYRIGQLLETMHRGDEARNAYGKAVEGSPDMPEAHLRYGVMSYLAGDMDAALSSLTRVVKLAPNTSMADEAKLYLNRMGGAVQPGVSQGHSSSVPPSDIEVINNQDLQRQQMQQLLPPPVVTKKQPVLEPPGMERIAPAADQNAPPQGQLIVLPETQSFNYIVQLGSFVDKQKAEEVRDSLREKGYSAIVKPLKHQVMGLVYLIQLKPVNSMSKASTLMTQLEGEVPGKPVIIKVPVQVRVPAESKPSDTQSPPVSN